jgi:uncharacterized membrane protein
MYGVAVLIVFAVFVLLIVLRLIWRLRNEQMEPGGSWGQQIFGRSDKRKPDDV